MWGFHGEGQKEGHPQGVEGGWWVEAVSQRPQAHGHDKEDGLALWMGSSELHRPESSVLRSCDFPSLLHAVWRMAVKRKRQGAPGEATSAWNWAGLRVRPCEPQGSPHGVSGCSDPPNKTLDLKTSRLVSWLCPALLYFTLECRTCVTASGF